MILEEALTALKTIKPEHRKAFKVCLNLGTDEDCLYLSIEALFCNKWELVQSKEIEVEV